MSPIYFDKYLKEDTNEEKEMLHKILCCSNNICVKKKSSFQINIQEKIKRIKSERNNKFSGIKVQEDIILPHNYVKELIRNKKQQEDMKERSKVIFIVYNSKECFSSLASM